MNRKKFLKLFGLGVGAVVIAPALIAKKEILYIFPEKANRPTIFYNGYWFNKQEWDNYKYWYDTQEQIMLKEMIKYYNKYDLTSFLNKISV